MKKLTLFALILFSSSSEAAWYRGNTHAHTLRADGDATPNEVAQWYHEHGYNFLVLSEHNKFIDPATVKIKEWRKDFILVPGIEVTGAKHVHTTALNVKKVIPWKTKNKLAAGDILKEHVARITALGGEAISNHPNWQWALTVNDLLGVKELKLFELFNGHPDTNTKGDKHHPSTEEMWDELLTLGKRIFAVSSDDAHYFHKHSHKLSNPGRGWIMVESEILSPEALVKSMTEGNFYASSGVTLSEVRRGPSRYVVTVDLPATKKNLSLPHIWGDAAGKKVGLSVEFIGINGKVLHVEELQEGKSLTASFVNGASPYIRAKVTYTVKGQGGSISHYAWTQPWWK